MISVDGLRHDLVDKYHAVHLQALRNEGVAASSMRPSYPSLTFPNHYTLVTGLYPSHHGLVDNGFFDMQRNAGYRMSDKKAVGDGTWYGGTPLWVLAEKQHMLSASFYWVASEAAIQGIRPTYYYVYNELIDLDTRIKIVKNWLTLPEEKRPHLIMFYLPQVDHVEHSYGPESRESADAVHLIDDFLGKMVKSLDSLHLPLNYVLVSDHGMTTVDTLHPIPMPSVIDTSKFYLADGDVTFHLYAKDKKDVQPAYEALKKQATDYDVYLPDQTPAYWHYTSADDKYGRIGDILLVPKWPKAFSIRGRRVTPGKHGYDNALPDMQATFYAWGPAFKQNMKIDSFENIHVYPMVAKVLGLTITDKIDGSVSVLQNILR
jgi:predicted AlkP superfamily pyrophosphatase or phosphodiesterase